MRLGLLGSTYFNRRLVRTHGLFYRIDATVAELGSVVVDRSIGLTSPGNSVIVRLGFLLGSTYFNSRLVRTHGLFNRVQAAVTELGSVVVDRPNFTREQCYHASRVPRIRFSVAFS